MKVLKTIDPQEQREVEELIQQQKRLHIAPSPVVYLTAEVQTLDGEPLARYEDRSHSWVRNYYNWMATQTLARGCDALGNAYGAGTLVMKDINGIVIGPGYSPPYTYSIDNNDHGINYGMRGASGNTNIGIVVGTGTDPENFDAYKLTTLIPNGTATGQLQYQEMGPGTLSWDSVGKKFVQVLERIFINSSGGTVTVGEVGLYGCFYVGGDYYFLLARDVLSPAIEVPNSSQLKVTYTIELALPA